MSTSQESFFSDVEVHDQGHSNVAAMVYALLAYGKACGQSPTAAATFAGDLFAPGWEEGLSAGAFWAARTIALNLATCGAEIRALTGDHERAELRLTGLPTEDDAALFGLTLAEADQMFDLFIPIAAFLATTYAWRREGDEIVITVG